MSTPRATVPPNPESEKMPNPKKRTMYYCGLLLPGSFVIIGEPNGINLINAFLISI